MADHQGGIGVSHFLHERMLWLLIASYFAAAWLPGPGLWLRQQRIDLPVFSAVGITSPGDPPVGVSLPTAMLAVLLFNAGLGIQAGELLRLLRQPVRLVAGLMANLAVPILFILFVSQTMRLWHDHDEVQQILVGLALVASMPIAGSSTAWTQNAGGDMALSLGLVTLSTCLSPVFTPLGFHAVGWMASGEYAHSLHTLAAGDVGLFLGLFVLTPSLLGASLRGLLGGTLIRRHKPVIRVANLVTLLLLCYSNAAVALPAVVAEPDWDFLALMMLVVSALCALAFFSGWAIGKLTAAPPAERSALMFSLGMNNNGTGLVIAATALSHLPAVLLPVIFYNLVQHVAAGIVQYRAASSDHGDKPLPPTSGQSRLPLVVAPAVPSKSAF